METEVSVDDLEQLPKWSWLVRPCENYKEELSDCRSIKARFHQYFIHGETADCSQWKTDHDNCLKFRKQKDLEALSEVIESERARRVERMTGHIQNDVWENRESPPEDWNKPLPENMKPDLDSSFLAAKVKEAELNEREKPSSLCTIS